MANIQIDIKTNGTTTLATAGKICDRNIDVNVAVPASGITPSGTKEIVQNGTFDVTNFAYALVNVPVPAQNIYTFPITVSSALGAGTNKNQAVLTGNDFVKAHYADDNFFAMWIPVNATTAVDSGVVGMVFHANRALITAKNTLYGIFLRSTGATAAPNFMGNTAKLNGSGYNVSLRANSSGNINLYVASAYTVPAGNYLLVLGLME